MINRPTEASVVQAAAAIISGTQIADAPLVTKVVPRWVLALAVGDAIDHLAKKDNDGNLLPVNSWVLTTASWLPAKAKSDKGFSQVPKTLTPGFDDWQVSSDTATPHDYKIVVTGSLKIWQLVQYQQGDDDANSELTSMAERQAVIDSFTKAPRLGLEGTDFEHDEIKFPALAILPFDGSLLHIAQGNLPFSFSYVVSAT